jgi:hypothetical protein
MLGASDSVEGGLGMAKELMGGIRQDAAALPGEFQDFVSMAQTLTPSLLNAGKGLKEIREMTRQTAVAGAAMLGGDFATASREMAMLLDGRAGVHNTLGMRMGIHRDTQVNGKGFNEASTSERFEFLQKKLSKNDAVLKLYEQSWKGLTSTMVDGVKQLLGTATGPLFGKLKADFAAFNKLLGAPEALTMSERVGRALISAHDFVADKVAWIHARWGSIESSATTFGNEVRDAFEKIWPIVEKIGGYLGEKLKDPGKFLKELAVLRVGLEGAKHAPDVLGLVGKLSGGGTGGAGSVVEQAVAAKLGATGFGSMKQAMKGEGAALGAHSADMANHVAWGGSILGPSAPMLANPLLAGAGAGEAAAVGGGVEAAVGIGALGAAAAVAAVALAAIAGAVDVLTIDTSTATGALRAFGVWGQEVWRDIKENFGGMWEELKTYWSDMMTAARPLVDLLGIALLGAIDGTIYLFRGLGWPLRQLAHALAWVVEQIPGYGKNLGDKMRVGSGNNWAADAIERAIDGPRDLHALVNKNALRKEQQEEANAAKDRAALLAKSALNGAGKTTVNVNAPISILASDDPERVAMRVATHLDTVLRNPKRATGYASFLQE